MGRERWAAPTTFYESRPTSGGWMPAIPLRISAASGNDRAQQGHPEAAGISRQGSDQGRDLLGSGEIVPRPQWRVKVTPKVFASELGLTNCRVIVFGLATSKGITSGFSSRARWPSSGEKTQEPKKHQPARGSSLFGNRLPPAEEWRSSEISVPDANRRSDAHSRHG